MLLGTTVVVACVPSLIPHIEEPVRCVFATAGVEDGPHVAEMKEEEEEDEEEEKGEETFFNGMSCVVDEEGIEEDMEDETKEDDERDTTEDAEEDKDDANVAKGELGCVFV
jgi:hypothetical protein